MAHWDDRPLLGPLEVFRTYCSCALGWIDHRIRSDLAMVHSRTSCYDRWKGAMARERAVMSGDGQLCRIEQAGERQGARSEIIFGGSSCQLLSAAQERSTALARAKKILDTIESGMAKSETLRQKLQEGSSRFPENLGCEQERQVLIARLVILIVARLAFHARRLDSSARQPRLNASR